MSEAIAKKAEVKEEIKQDIAEQAPSRSEGEMRDSIGRTASAESSENQEAFEKMQKYEGAEPQDIAEAEKIKNESEQAMSEAKAEAMREMGEVSGEARNEQRDTTPADKPKEVSQEISKESSPATVSEATSEEKKIYENPEDDPMISNTDKEIQGRVTERVRGRESEYDTNSVQAERHHASINVFEHLAEENPEKMRLYLEYGNEKFKDRQDAVPTWYKYLKMAIEFLTNKRNVEKLEKEYGIEKGRKIVIENQVWIIANMGDRGVELVSERTGEQREIKGERLEAFTKAVEENIGETQTKRAETKPESQTKIEDQKLKPENSTTKTNPEAVFADSGWRAPDPEAPARASANNLGESATIQNAPATVADRGPWNSGNSGEDFEQVSVLNEKSNAEIKTNPEQSAKEGIASSLLLSVDKSTEIKESKESFPEGHILHPDTFKKIAMVEAIDEDGNFSQRRYDAFVAQDAKGGEYSVQLHQENLRKILEMDGSIESSDYTYSNMYGNGGWNRYRIDEDGIVYIRQDVMKGTEENKRQREAKARELGLRVGER